MCGGGIAAAHDLNVSLKDLFAEIAAIQKKFANAYNPATGKVKLDSADKSDTLSFAKNAVSKELGENRFKHLIKKVGETQAMAMLGRTWKVGLTKM